jgi:nucleoid DNA-binding protein
MREFVNVITKLLSKHTCVIIPGFGGFVVNEKAALVDRQTDHFYPPRKEIIFNPHLFHNDGLLAHALMQSENISFEKAGEKINENVRTIRNALAAYRKYDLEEFGCFAMEEGRIIFYPKKINLGNENTLGLKEFYFPTLQSGNRTGLAVEPIEHNHERSSFSKIVIGGVAATLALFLFCQPIKNEGVSDRASLIPVQSVTDNLFAAEKAAKESEKKDMTFHIITAEFPTEKEALTYMEQIKLDPQDKLELLPVGNQFYVAISTIALQESGKGDSFSYLEEIALRYPELTRLYILGLR